MRYLWDHYHFYRSHAGLPSRLMLPMLAPLLRSWDVNTSMRVDRFVANSHHVGDRISKYYRRHATVLYPPVNVDDFTPTALVEDFYLCAGQLVPYKRVDLAVKAFSRMGRKLVVIGEGSQMEELKRIAGPSVTFLGRAPFSVLKEKLARCRALIFPGEEDFGIVPVEAMASGRPVIAYGSGGALETIVPGVTGLFFDEQSVDALIDAVHDFEASERRFHPATLHAHSEQFSLQTFTAGMRAIINEELMIRKADKLRSYPAIQRALESQLPMFATDSPTTTLQ